MHVHLPYLRIANGVNARVCPELKYCMEISSLTSFYADAEGTWPAGMGPLDST